MVRKTFDQVKYNKNTKEKYPICRHKSLDKNHQIGFIKCIYPVNPPLLPTEITDRKMLTATKIEIFPTKHQRHTLKVWFKIYKKVYNLAIDLAQKHEEYKFFNLRDKYVRPLYKELYKNKIKKYKINLKTLDNAINDVCKAHASTKANLKAGNITHFRLRPKRKCENKETILINGECFDKPKKGRKTKNGVVGNREAINSFAFSAFGEFDCSENFAGTTHDTRLTFDKRQNKFYLFRVDEISVIKKTNERKRECALDPGIRTFQTCYDKKSCISLGTGLDETFVPLFKRIDKVAKFKNKPWYKKYTSRIYQKIQNKKDELHWQVANFLVKRYDEITIGKMSTSIVSKTKNMSKLNKRIYYAQAHFTFRQRLQFKCNQYGVKYNEIDESYTTQKCGNCGILNKVDRATVYNCGKCSFKWGRDHNGARNIMIKKDLRV